MCDRLEGGKLRMPETLEPMTESETNARKNHATFLKSYWLLKVVIEIQYDIINSE